LGQAQKPSDLSLKKKGDLKMLEGSDNLDDIGPILTLDFKKMLKHPLSSFPVCGNGG
jgi:hypothetical protein